MKCLRTSDDWSTSYEHWNSGTVLIFPSFLVATFFSLFLLTTYEEDDISQFIRRRMVGLCLHVEWNIKSLLCKHWQHSKWSICYLNGSVVKSLQKHRQRWWWGNLCSCKLLLHSFHTQIGWVHFVVVIGSH